jgi:hypothetical protein
VTAGFRYSRLNEAASRPYGICIVFPVVGGRAKFLHNLRILPVGIEESFEGVPERMLENPPGWDRSITAAAWFSSRPHSLTFCVAIIAWQANCLTYTISI